MKVAIVHDYLIQYGGAERVLQDVCEVFPDAPIYTLLYDQANTGGVFKDRDVHTSFLQRLPFVRSHHRFFPWLMPLAVEQFDLSYYDVVISISHSFGKGIITKPDTRHICYCLTPPRFLWDGSHQQISEFRLPWPFKKLLPYLVSYLRLWDHQASDRVDAYVGISQFVQERIQKYYGRRSKLIYPPVVAQKFYIEQQVEDYFLMVGRFVPYKRFDLAIKTFTSMGLPLKIVGDGPERERLEDLAGDNVEFLGRLSDYKLPELYAKAQAVIFPQEEDFGIVPLEANASGRPVVAYRSGGATETVVEGTTGVFFDEQSEISLAEAVGKCRMTNWNPQEIREHAMSFDRERFMREMAELVTQKELL